MKLRISVVTYGDDATRVPRDIRLACDVTATVGKVARSLVRGGAGRPRLLPGAVHRHAPITLLVTSLNGTRALLDTGDPIASAGLVSGCTVEPVLEVGGAEGTRRAKTPAAAVTVLSGDQEGVSFLLPAGTATLGRDRGNRIELHDPRPAPRGCVAAARAGRPDRVRARRRGARAH